MKAALLVTMFHSITKNPLIAFIGIIAFIAVYLGYKMFETLSNKYRLYSILTAVILISYTFFLYNLTTFELLGDIIRNMFIGITIFFCKQNSYFSKKLAVISVCPSLLLTLGGLYMALSAVPLSQEVINEFPEMTNVSDLYLKIIENNNLITFLEESEILLEMIVLIIFSVIGNIIIISGGYYCVHHFLLKKHL
jgi:hypothetical protein